MKDAEKILNRNRVATSYRFEVGMKEVADTVADVENISLTDLLCASLRYYISSKYPEIVLPEVEPKWAKQKGWAKERKQKQVPATLLFAGV